MRAEIIAVGTELTTGAKLDTNSQWLSQELAALGIPVVFHTTVADDLEANVDCLHIAVDRADLVIISGGLGPTLDDLTRQAMADLIGVELQLHQPSLDAIRDMFSRRNRVMPERNVVQALFPATSEPIPNERGTAPGIWMTLPREERSPCILVAMPGVPSELKAMFQTAVASRLSRLFPSKKFIRSGKLHCFGVGESHAEELLGDLTARGRDPEVGITVHEATITLRIETQAESSAECESKIVETMRIARDRLGDLVYGEGDEELEDHLIRMLQVEGKTLSSAEISTGGLLAMKLSSAQGEGTTVYRGGWIQQAAQTPLFSRGKTTIIEEPELIEWGKSCREKFQTDYTLVVGPIQDSTAVRIVLVGAEKTLTQELNVLGDPTITKSRNAKTAMNMLRLLIQKSTP